LSGRKINVLRKDGKAYLFILYLVLAKNGAEDWNSRLIANLDLSDITKHHIFPKEYLDESLSTQELEDKEILINNLGNVTFIDKSVNSSIGDQPPEDYMKTYIGALANHLIPKDENLWSVDQYSTFLDFRVKQLYIQGTKFFPEVFLESRK
jgi:hypothetical protein